MSLTPEDIERRIRAKRVNERLKLLESSVNTLGLTVLGAAVLVPMIGGQITFTAVIWILIAVGLHFFAQTLLGWLRSEGLRSWSCRSGFSWASRPAHWRCD